MRYALALDLKDNAALIAEYERLHRAIWPEVRTHLREAHVEGMTIWRLGTRLFMLMQTGPGFSFELMAALATGNDCIQAWETLMWRFQAPTPWTPAHEKWVPMTQIFDLQEADHQTSEPCHQAQRQ